MYDDELFRQKLKECMFLGVDICSRSCEKQLSRFEVQYELEKHNSDKVDAISKKLSWLENKKILEIGCGAGGLATALALRGAEVIGLEPEATGLAASKLRAERYPGIKINFVSGVGESLPFDDCSFDAVLLLEVIEHVKDPIQVLKEIQRVLKPGGIVLIEAPNYLWPQEPHYRVWFPPLLPKSLAALYLRMRKKNPAEIYRINYITPRYLARALRAANLDVEDVGLAEWLAKLYKPEDMQWNKRVGKILVSLKKLGFIYGFLVAILSLPIRLGFYPNIRFKAKKS